MKTTETEERWTDSIRIDGDLLERLLGVPGMIDYQPGDTVSIRINQDKSDLLDRTWYGSLRLNGYVMEWDGVVPTISVTVTRRAVEEG